MVFLPALAASKRNSDTRGPKSKEAPSALVSARTNIAHDLEIRLKFSGAAAPEILHSWDLVAKRFLEVEAN